MVIALGIHLFPFRTEKLSPTTSMVLRKSGRVDSRRFKEESRFSFESAFFGFKISDICKERYDTSTFYYIMEFLSFAIERL